MNKKNIFLYSLPVLLIIFGLFGAVSQAKASATDNVSGYAWSSNIGWISFNCTNTSTCTTSNYGVNKNDDGTLVGYAWSSNIGWIQFGSLSGFPAGYGTTSANAKLAGTSLTGWARALAGCQTISGIPASSCGSGWSSNTANGSWDGWISLDGKPLDQSGYYGVSVNTTSGALTGFAWGSDVVGWIEFQANVIVDGMVGLCGSADGQSFTTAPANNLCSTGTQTTVSGAGPWTWSCNGSDSNSSIDDASCTSSLTPPVVSGVCGTANNKIYFSNNTSYNPDTICLSPGTSSPSVPAFPGVGSTTSWVCKGSDSNSSTDDVPCSASRNTIVGGVCGSADGQSFTTAPANNLCSTGTQTTVSGAGPWTWSCNGSDSNSSIDDANCMAPMTASSIILTPWCSGTQGVISLWSTPDLIGTTCSGITPPWIIPSASQSRNVSAGAYSLTCGSITSNVSVPVCTGTTPPDPPSVCPPGSSPCPKPPAKPIFQEI